MMSRKEILIVLQLVVVVMSLILCGLVFGQETSTYPQNQPQQTKQEPKKTEAMPDMPAKIYDKLAKVTVNIICNNGLKNGTGTIIGLTPDGRALILTVCHVVASNFEETDPNISLAFYGDVKVKVASEMAPLAASVLPRFLDRANDLALIVTNQPVSSEEVVSYTRIEDIKPGEKVAAFGYPQSDRLSQTVGRITRLEPKYLVFDARIAPGNSGGPLVDKNGRMIGVSTFVNNTTEGFALHMNLVLPIVEDWIKEIKLSKQWKFEKDGKPIWPFIAGGAVLGVGGALLLSGGGGGGNEPAPNVFPFPIRPNGN